MLPLHASIPVRAVSVANLREHWSATAMRAKKHRESAWAALAHASGFGRWMPKAKVAVTLTRVGAKELDTDNLASSLKACRDGVADWLMLDDASPLIEWRYAQRKGSYSVEVDIV